MPKNIVNGGVVRYTVVMSSSDKYIIIEESKNLNDGSSTSDVEVSKETEADCDVVLNQQGVFIQSSTKQDETGATEETSAQFSKELLDESGIEIVPGKKDVD